MHQILEGTNGTLRFSWVTSPLRPSHSTLYLLARNRDHETYRGTPGVERRSCQVSDAAPSHEPVPLTHHDVRLCRSPSSPWRSSLGTELMRVLAAADRPSGFQPFFELLFCPLFNKRLDEVICCGTVARRCRRHLGIERLVVVCHCVPNVTKWETSSRLKPTRHCQGIQNDLAPCNRKPADAQHHCCLLLFPPHARLHAQPSDKCWPFG